MPAENEVKRNARLLDQRIAAAVSQGYKDLVVTGIMTPDDFKQCGEAAIYEAIHMARWLAEGPTRQEG